MVTMIPIVRDAMMVSSVPVGVVVLIVRSGWNESGGSNIAIETIVGTTSIP